jgi:hypothetical protein
VPAEEIREQAAYTEIDQVVWRRFSASNEDREYDQLDEVGDDRHEEGGFHARAGRDCDFALNRIGLPRRCSHVFSIYDAHDAREAGEKRGIRNQGLMRDGGEPMRDEMKSIVDEVAAWPGVTSHDHRFGGTEFRLGEREIGHVHDFGIVDIPFTVKIRDALIRAGRAERHHWLPNSGWTTVRVGEHGRGNAVQLLRLSYLRIRRKSPDAGVVSDAERELAILGLETELMDGVGISPVAEVGVASTGR